MGRTAVSVYQHLRTAIASRTPASLDEQSMLLPEIPRGGRHDRALADYDFAALSQRLTHVVFAHEVGGFFDSLRRCRRR